MVCLQDLSAAAGGITYRSLDLRRRPMASYIAHTPAPNSAMISPNPHTFGRTLAIAHHSLSNSHPLTYSTGDDLFVRYLISPLLLYPRA